MVTGADVLGMLIPQGGWIITGEDYEGIEFLECAPITKQEYLDGFATYENYAQTVKAEKSAAKAALLERLGITADEAASLLS
jgi:hypothetical protein